MRNDFKALCGACLRFPRKIVDGLKRGLGLTATATKDFLGFAEKKAPVFSERIRKLGIMLPFEAAMAPLFAAVPLVPSPGRARAHTRTLSK